jgi:hypothetical protein
MIKKFTFYVKLYLSAFFIIVCISFQTKAQTIKRQSIASIGASGTTGDATFHQTIGQPYNTTAHYSNELSISQGFQQPAVSSLKKINADQVSNLQLKIYPNPAAYYVTVESQNVLKTALIQVTDINARVIVNSTVAELKTYTINSGTWPNGVYFVNISDNNLNKSIFKLIINN